MMTLSKRLEGFKAESELMGQPRRVVEVPMNVQGWEWEAVEWRQIVRDDAEDIIFTRNPSKILIDTLSEALGKPFFAVYFIGLAGRREDQIAIGLPVGEVLTDDETAAVAMAAWLNNRYYPGVKKSDRSDGTLMPAAMNTHTDQGEYHTGLPAVFYGRDMADEMATIIARLYDAKPRIVRDGDRWGVSVTDQRFGDSRRMMELMGIYRLLCKYDIAPKQGARLVSESAAFADRVADLAHTEDIRDAAQQRIEEGIGLLLAHFDLPLPGADLTPAAPIAVEDEPPAPATRDTHTRSAPRKPAPEAAPTNKRASKAGGKTSSSGKGKQTKASA